MKDYLQVLNKVGLFEGIAEKDLVTMLSCLETNISDFTRDQFVLLEGDRIENIGIVLAGEVHVIREDVDGGRMIIAVLGAGEYFAEALCCAGVEKSPVSVVAVNSSRIMFLNFRQILHFCCKACGFHTKLIENMLLVIANKNLLLQSRLAVISRKSIRMKVITYLKYLAKEQGKHITIPLNREELADYLCTDRSALSHELARMKEAGIIDYHKNHFKLL